MRSVHRAFDVLKVLELAQQPLRLTDIAQRTALHVATTQRLVGVLTDHGYASRHANGYTAGPAALSTAHAFATTSPLRLVARPVLEEVATATGLTASLYVRVQDTRVLIDRVEGGQRPHYSLPIGERLPLYPGAAGKVFLAGDPDNDLGKIADELQPITFADGTVLDASAIHSDLQRIRDNGFATSVDERRFDTTAVAALIRDTADRPLGSIGLTGATHSLGDVGAGALPADVRRAAQAIGSRVPAGA
ncbi:IclR family acetate operon transcriptional repressor [Prauserella isguenensis]|uniref:IclR family acetate operon transcriptional repressor n=1 Tax=Prauserella isguenensis TaxID=1470180 RepID=A0A839RWN6_9PSEU|nr:IclR family transcriptional regulator [Prauserella isguenensis]MBB3049543.1 IclR family acetate operon transcriptional repressor [Prauserella isguenensis]